MTPSLRSWIDDTVAAAGEMNEAYIRILFTRGVGELNTNPKSTSEPDDRDHRETAPRAAGPGI